MKDQYQGLIKQCQDKALSYELEAEQEMKTGSGAKAMELCRLADMQKINAKNYKIRMESL